MRHAIGDPLILGATLLAAITTKSRGRHRTASPVTDEHYLVSRDGQTVYHVDKKGTRRRVTDEVAAEVLERLRGNKPDATDKDE